ncbi:MAG: hypothetical protein ABJF23_05225 [Bryobacteraceae bacterium]
MRTPCKLMLAPVAAFLLATALPAQDASELLNRMKAMEDRIHALENEVQTLKAQQAPAAALQPQPAPVAPQPVPLPSVDTASLGGAGGAAAKVLNPDISVIGDFIGAVGSHGGRPTPSLEMHESEVGFQEVIDPYARADFFISFGEKGVNLEEGYITFTALPAGLQLKAGKMRAAFGRVNTTHNHVLPWIDRPLVTQNLVGGEDGINDAGLSLSRILPAPKGLFLEGIAQVFRGDSDGVFSAIRRTNVSAVGHLHGYHDISESTNIDFGASYARGHSPFADASNQLYGLDATFHWKPLRRAIYHSFIARSEFIWARTNVDSPGQIRSLAKPFGFYVAGDYQVGRRWMFGARFDRSQRGNCLPTIPETTAPCVNDLDTEARFRNFTLRQDTGGSILLTYLPSEFSLIRTQFRRARYGEGLTANELLFQFQFSMGAHGAHPF